MQHDNHLIDEDMGHGCCLLRLKEKGSLGGVWVPHHPHINWAIFGCRVSRTSDPKGESFPGTLEEQS